MTTTAFCPRLLVAFVLCLPAPAFAQPQEDVPGSRDHPLLSRFPGSVIVRYDEGEFDELLVPLGKSTGIGEFDAAERVEGKVTRLTYEMPVGHSTLEVLQSYREALVEAGFEIPFTCAREECGSHLDFQKLERPFIIDQDHRYLAAKGDLPEGRVWVTVRTYTTARQDPPLRAMVHIAEIGPLEEGLITVDAAAMAKDLETRGHVAVYGIHFDTDKAEIKPGSEATLAEMAKLLAENPRLEVYIVGHTDNVGTLEHNMDLSRRRAQAVVEALVAQHGAERSRLTPEGVGPWAPVESNRTEEGRAKNRRVELVEK